MPENFQAYTDELPVAAARLARFLKMRRHYISSSVIRWYGFDPAAEALEIEFISGHVYRYSGVPGTTYAALEAARSKGQYFDYNIREKFPTERVR